MREAVLAKFTQHARLQTSLIATHHDEELIEANHHDCYWSCGTNGTGKNMLGKIVIEIRAQLRKGRAPRDTKKTHHG